MIDMKMLKSQFNRQLLQSEIEILKLLKSYDNILRIEDYTVINNGTNVAGASTLAVYLSTNTTITSFDNLISLD